MAIGALVFLFSFALSAVVNKVTAVSYTHLVRQDGYFDEATREAVMAFQEGFGLPVTGFVDRETWDVIYNYYLTLTGRATAKTKIWVYDEYENRMMVYYRAESESMPYSYGTTLRVREFRGSSKSPKMCIRDRVKTARRRRGEAGMPSREHPHRTPRAGRCV